MERQRATTQGARQKHQVVALLVVLFAAQCTASDEPATSSNAGSSGASGSLSGASGSGGVAGASGAGGSGASGSASANAGSSGTSATSGSGGDLDAGQDADANLDADTDASLPDDIDPIAPASPYCAEGKRWAGWKRVSQPGQCNLYLPINLQAAVPPLTWSACPNAAGCMMMDNPWQYSGLETAYSPRLQKDGSGGEWLFVSEYQHCSAGTFRWVSVVYDLKNDNRALYAWGSDGDVSPGLCIQFGGFYEKNMVMGMLPPLDHPELPSHPYPYFEGPIAAYANYPNPLVVTEYLGWGASGMALGKHILGLQPGGHIGVMSLSTGQVTEFHPPNTSFFDQPVVSGDDLFVRNNLATPNELWVRRANGEGEKLLGNAMTNISSFGTDGVDMAWLQSRYVSESVWDNYEIWQAPYANTASATHGTKKTSVSFIQPGTYTAPLHVRKGHAGMVYSGGHRIYRLSDGSYYQAPAEPIPGYGYMALDWVDDTEMVSVMGPDDHARTVVRIQLSAMELHPPQ